MKSILNELYNNFNGKHITAVLVDNVIWIKGTDVTNILGYSCLQKPLEVINEDDKITYHQIKNNYKEMAFFTSNKNMKLFQNTIFINQKGLVGLIMKSKKPTAQEFFSWITKEIMPSIFKHENYSIDPINLDIKPIYTSVELEKFYYKHVTYLLYVGIYGVDITLKYGFTDNLKRRLKEHEATFITVVVLHVSITDENKKVENELYREWDQRGMIHPKIIKGKKRTELIVPNSKMSVQDCVELIKRKVSEIKSDTEIKYEKLVQEKDAEIKMLKELNTKILKEKNDEEQKNRLLKEINNKLIKEKSIQRQKNIKIHKKIKVKNEIITKKNSEIQHLEDTHNLRIEQINTDLQKLRDYNTELVNDNCKLKEHILEYNMN